MSAAQKRVSHVAPSSMSTRRITTARIADDVRDDMKKIAAIEEKSLEVYLDDVLRAFIRNYSHSPAIRSMFSSLKRPK